MTGAQTTEHLGAAGERAHERIEETTAHYGRPDETLGGYVRIMAVYSVLVAGVAGLLHWRGKLPDRINVSDLALATAATHKLSRTLAKDTVSAPLRAPFATFEGPAGPGEVSENVDGKGPRKAIGELVTCPFCMDQWVATGFLSGMLLLPRLTRFIAGLFAVRAGADFLQIVYARGQKAAKG
jgi:hypothetical protein